VEQIDAKVEAIKKTIKVDIDDRQIDVDGMDCMDEDTRSIGGKRRR